MLDWLLHPIAMFAFIAVAAGLNLWLFFTLKIEGAKSSAEAEGRARELEAAVADLRLRVHVLESRAAEEPEPVEAVVPAPELPPGDLNLTRRAQALRLARRGETPAKIASALGIPQNEVELLLKVQGILTESL